MSWQATGWAFKAKLGNPGAKAVLVALADHAGNGDDEDWTCYPSIKKLSGYTEQGVRTIQRHLDWLVGNGWISRERKRRKDGSLGVYLFTLHRDRPEWRHAKPVAKKDDPSRHDDGSPPAKVAALNLPVEPTIEPSMERDSADASDEEFDLFGDRPKAKPVPKAPVKELSHEKAAKLSFPFFWEGYPRKVAKGAAERAWIAAIVEMAPHLGIPGAAGEAAEIIRMGCQNLARDCFGMTKDELRYIPHASTWIRDRGWEDEPGARARSKSDGTGTGRNDVARARKLEERGTSIDSMLAGAMAVARRYE